MRIPRLTLSMLMAFALTALISSCSSDTADRGKDMGDKMENAAKDMKEDVKDVADDMKDAAEDATDDMADAADNAMDEMDSKGTDLDFAEGSWGYSIKDYMANGSGSRTFDLDQVTQEKGEELSAEADQQLADLAALLKANPTMEVEVQAHSREGKNAVGKKTKKAGTSIRAEWVKLKLKAKGVDGKQLRASGYGDENLLEGVPGDDDKQRRLTVMFTK